MITPPEGSRRLKHLVIAEVYGEPTQTKKPEKYYVSSNITDQAVCVYNEYNGTWSDNSVYKGPKGLYFKKDGKRWYLKDFE